MLAIIGRELRHARRRHQLSFTAIIILYSCVKRTTLTARAGSSAICAGTLVSIAITTAAYCQSEQSKWRSCSIVGCEHPSAKSILEFLHIMADEPACMGSLSVIRFAQLKENVGCKTKLISGDDERVLTAPRRCWLTQRSKPIGRQTNCTLKRRLRKSPWLRKA